MGGDLVTGQKVSREPKRASQRLFLGKLPLTITASKLRRAFGNAKIKTIQWIIDFDTKGFYGSAFCQMASMEDATKVHALGSIPISQHKRKRKQKVRVAYAPLRENEIWPLESYLEKEYPPIGF